EPATVRGEIKLLTVRAPRRITRPTASAVALVSGCTVVRAPYRECAPSCASGWGDAFSEPPPMSACRVVDWCQTSADRTIQVHCAHQPTGPWHSEGRPPGSGEPVLGRPLISPNSPLTRCQTRPGIRSGRASEAFGAGDPAADPEAAPAM